MAEAVAYKKPRKLNVVVIAILVALIAGAYGAWAYVPLMLRKFEVMRVLDESSSQFTGESARMLADRKQVDRLRREMVAAIQALGVDDPQAEYWIEIDGEHQVRFGVLYSDWLRLPFIEARERIIELQMLCTRAGPGGAWTCEGQDLQREEFQPPQI